MCYNIGCAQASLRGHNVGIVIITQLRMVVTTIILEGQTFAVAYTAMIVAMMVTDVVMMVTSEY